MAPELNKIRYYTFTVVVESSRVMKLIASNSVLNGAVIVSFRTRRASASRRSLLNEAIVNDNNFNAAFLVLKKGQENVYEYLPLEHIEKATNEMPHLGFPVNLSNVNWDTSSLEVAEGVTLDTGNVFEFTVGFYLLTSK
jgi:hypothetical protein